MQNAQHRIKLTTFDHSDSALFIEMFMCPQLMEHVYDPFTYEEAKEIFESKSKTWSLGSDDWLSFGITEISTGEKLGNIGLKIIDHKAKIAEVGFMLKLSAQGKGFACEALTLLKDHAYNRLNLNKLTAICAVNNTNSYKLLEKAGFVREACLKQNAFINNTFADDYLYGLSR